MMVALTVARMGGTMVVSSVDWWVWTQVALTVVSWADA